PGVPGVAGRHRRGEGAVLRSEKTDAKAGPGANKRSALFLVRFVLLLVAFYAIVASHPVNDAVIVPFTGAIARVSAGILHVLGEKVTVSGTEIRSRRFAVAIANGFHGAP